jgi:hypothetical protein
MIEARMDMGDVVLLCQWVHRRMAQDFEDYEREHGPYPPGDPDPIIFPLRRIEEAIAKARGATGDGE